MIKPLPGSGNHMVDAEDSDSTRYDDGDAPEFHCPECGEYVDYNDWNSKTEKCWNCHWRIT